MIEPETAEERHQEIIARVEEIVTAARRHLGVG